MTDATPLDALVQEVLNAARAHNLRIATAESCTGGLIAGALTEVPGASDVVECGFVTYSNAAKQRMLGVKAKTLTAHGAVSPEVALEMAQGALQNSFADLTVAVTGIAGPGGSEFKPEGRVCFAACRSGADPVVQTVEFGALGRTQVRQAAMRHALAMLKQLAGAETKTVQPRA